MEKETALKILRELHDKALFSERTALETLVPELESEDEKIRNEIIMYIGSKVIDSSIHNRWLTWLEKQGKQKPSWSEEDENVIETLIRELRLNAQFEFAVRKLGLDYIQTLTVLDKCRRLCPQPKQEWNKEDEKIISLLIKIFEVNHPNGHFKVNPIGTTNMEDISTKEIVDWLKSLKDKIQPQPKQEWSEEDIEKMVKKRALSLGTTASEMTFYRQGIEDTVKSLKPNHWKPSEQNIKDLEWCADLVKDKMGVGFHRLQVFIDELRNL